MTDKKGMAFAGATVKAEAVGLIEASNRTVWDRVDPAADVQIEGRTIEGRIRNGDTVVLEGWKPGTVFKTNSVFIATMETHVIAR